MKMARTAGRNIDEMIQHTVSVRYRVYGTGVLRTTLYSYQDVTSSTLPTITMENATDKHPTILSNFSNQKTQIQFQVTGYDETFVISKILAFVKPTATGHPI